MSLHIQREHIMLIKKSEYFYIIADSTTDTSADEQFSLYIHFVN